jgi:hypothetical protein
VAEMTDNRPDGSRLWGGMINLSQCKIAPVAFVKGMQMLTKGGESQQVPEHLLPNATKVSEVHAVSCGKDGRHEETRTPDLYRVKVAL